MALAASVVWCGSGEVTSMLLRVDIEKIGYWVGGVSVVSVCLQQSFLGEWWEELFARAVCVPFVYTGRVDCADAPERKWHLVVAFF